MHERIKQIRKHFRMTQAELGQRIGVAPNTVTNYEAGRREPTAAVILAICREFDVNEGWLRTGEGEMFVELPEGTELGKYIADVIGSDDEFIKNAIISYMKLDEKNKKIIRDFMKSLGSSEGME